MQDGHPMVTTQMTLTQTTATSQMVIHPMKKRLKDCPITVFSADVYGDDASGAMQVVFPGGITWFSTVDEVEADLWYSTG